jgi:hypothetical protein
MRGEKPNRAIVAVALLVWLPGCAPRRPTHATALACVERMEADRRGCFQDCEREFEDAFVGCYGRNRCTDACETRQLACQAGPLRELSLCGEGPDDPSSCQARLHSDLQACADRSDRVACEDGARRRAAGCWQVCRRAHAPVLDRCAMTFRTCLDACVPR